MPSLWVLVSHLLQRDLTIARRVTRTLRSGSMRAWDTSRQTTYFRAMSRYVPPRIRADMVCLLCEEFSTKRAYAAAPWKQLAMNVRSETIPGQHNTCISRHVGELAACLNRLMVGRSATSTNDAQSFGDVIENANIKI
jgi:hypothetical protein